MKILTNLFVLFFFGSQLVFSQNPTNKPVKFKIDFATEKQLKFSEIFSDVNYISFETNKNCLLSTFNVQEYGENVIFIHNHADGTIYRFSETGKFLNKIGNKGKGPGEYMDVTKAKLIGDKVYVLTTFTNIILCYTLDGKFIKSYKIDSNELAQSFIEMPDKSFLISLRSMNPKGNILRTNSEFKIQKWFKIDLSLKYNPLPFGLVDLGKRIYYFENFMRTIYDFTSGIPVPAIELDYGKYRLSNQKTLLSEIEKEISNGPYIIQFNGSNELLLLDVFYQYDWTTHSTLYRFSDGKLIQWTSMTNDFDNGTIDRWNGRLIGNNSMIFNLMPSTIIERYDNMSQKEKTDPKNKKFVEMASKITINSNPVLMVCKLKAFNLSLNN